MDHKTGENLVPKMPKQENIHQTVISQIEPTDNLVADIKLSKTEELLLQQGIFNFPLSDDKFTLQQSLDFLGGKQENYKNTEKL